MMPWNVIFHDDFSPEVDELDAEVQDELLAAVKLLEAFGPTLGRPHADTLKGSRHANMKELRFEAVGGIWRVAYAFDPRRRGVLLVGGDKAGGGGKRFYKALIEKADRRYDDHLKQLKRR
jgi:hypothetical protein